MKLINTLIQIYLCFNVFLIQIFTTKIKQLLDEDLKIIPGYIPSLETSERISLSDSPSNSFYSKKNIQHSNIINRKYDDVSISSENGNYNAYSNEWSNSIKKNLYKDLNQIDPLFDPYNTKIEDRYQSFDELNGIVNTSKDYLVDDNIIGINSSNNKIKLKITEDNPMIINKEMFDLNVNSINKGIYKSRWYDGSINSKSTSKFFNNNNANGVYYDADKLRLKNDGLNNDITNNNHSNSKIILNTNTNINLDKLYQDSNPRYIVSLFFIRQM